MIAFWILFAIGIVLIWFLAAFLYRPIGRLAHRIWSDSMGELGIISYTKDNEDSNKEKEEKEI